ncbi:PREDICTED: gamma-tubulin complex component 2 isoform X1 [Camelina sativa]|uniref:Gamma-tubulin complex component n=1 Tax=Camelina sativa TaxID=90675 RepID=A0ABM1QUW1_CAMSA|nr:PREDICTED: gamma-tubulin complex component 2 isoform X1 [Camelina sativa]
MESMSPISCPTTPRWNQDRPFLTGRFHQETRASSKLADSKRFPVDSSSSGVDQAIGCHETPLQELIVIDDLLSALVGIEGRYISIIRFHGKEDRIAFQVDPSMDLALQELAKRIFPLCEYYLLIDQFVESSSQFKNGLVNHAFAAALRALLLDYQAMVAQLEHQFRLGRLSIQGLWFYCQPMMGSMRALAAVVQQASTKHFVGSGVLNLLQSQAKAMAGDNSVRSLLEKMTECASNAYLSILERSNWRACLLSFLWWVYEGIIEDPYGEFFIAENRSLKKESLSQDSTAKYWSQRYSLKDTIPGFLANIAATILTTGKYLNVMRECGHNVQVPISERSKLTIFGSNHHYLECIKAAHEFASIELVNLIKDKYDLIGRLRSIKHYLLLDQGDFLVHFMDIAREELNKKVHEVSVEKLQSLLDLALRTTAAAADPCHEDLTCCVDRASLLTTLGMHKDSDSNNIEDPVSITGLETFSLSYKVQWPLSIVISKKALSKYQLIFRFLFHCKHVERQLCGAWQIHQGIRSMNSKGTAIPRSSLLCRSMLKFISSLLHYLTFEVLEPNWHVMHDRLQSTRSVDEVIQHHDFFLDKCLRGCLLLLPDVLKKMEKLKSVCLQYAAATQWLISSSIDINSQSHPQKTMIRDTTVTESIFNFEREFNSELQSLGPVLSKGSQAEPYLTHLSQWILGVSKE